MRHLDRKLIKPRTSKLKKCIFCGKEFWVEKNETKKGVGKFCSSVCRRLGSYTPEVRKKMSLVWSPRTPWNKGKIFIPLETQKEKIKESKRLWHKKNPHKAYWYTLTRRMRKKNVGGRFSQEEWESIKKEYNYTCPCCGVKEPEVRLTIDHIKPIRLGGKHTSKNIQPLCHKCNVRKHIKNIKYDKWL